MGPYKAADETCRRETPVVTVEGYEATRSNSEKNVLDDLVHKGPLAIVVAASPWAFYGGGVFNNCGYDGNVDLNHGVTLDGYGEEDGKMYWLVRNSWGEEWGEEGYIKIVRERK